MQSDPRMIMILAAILFAAFGLDSWSRQEADTGGEGILLEEFVFLRSPHFRSCHAATLLELPDGDLLCAFFAGTRESDPDVEIWLSRKPSGGTWSEPVSIADGVEPGVERMSTGNPVLFRERSGKVILFYKVIRPGVGFEGRLKTSVDGGRTWSEPRPVGDGLIGAVKNKPVQLEDGTILSPSSTEDEHGWRVHVERSTDGGNTWETSGPVNPEAGIGAIQPTLMTFPDGRILMYCRTRSEHGFIARSWSRDGGLSWSPLEATVLPNNNSGLDAVTLRDGRQLLVYNHSTRTQEGMGHKGRGILNVALSPDGINWEAALILEYLDQPGKQFSYPSVIQTGDGLVHMVYTWHRERIKHVVLDPGLLKTQPMPDGKWPAKGPFSLEAYKASRAGEPVKIMPVGNSITAGEHYGFPSLAKRTGYRKILYEMLVNNGYHVDFVGSQKHGMKPENDKDWYDWNCEAYPGWKIPDIAHKVDSAMEVFEPDILLVHVGTNGSEWNDKPIQVMDMLDGINRYSVNHNHPVTVFLCQIINRFEEEDQVPTARFNQEVVKMANARKGDRIRIILVDMENDAGLDYSDRLPDPDAKPPYEGGDMLGHRYPGVPYDKYHPNDRGNTKMAEKFYQELVKVL